MFFQNFISFQKGDFKGLPQNDQHTSGKIFTDNIGSNSKDGKSEIYISKSSQLVLSRM
jgi:hypothetical protein